MIIDVFSDPICPWCYIGKRRLERALGESHSKGGVALHWRAFQLNPEMPAYGMPRQDYVALKFGGAGRAGDFYRNVAAVGAGEDIAFDFERIKRTPNTVNAHRLIRYATRHGKGDEIVEALFRAYFLDGRDIGEIAVLAKIAGENGMNAVDVRAFLYSNEDIVEVRAEHNFAISLNITGVPCFIVENQYVVTGAREPQAFMPVFDLVAEERRLTTAP